MAKSFTGSPITASFRAPRAWLTLSLLAFAWVVAPPPASADDCTAASDALARAQAALSKATRDADTRADAYAQCMSAGGNCAPKKAAYDAAISAKAKALAALKAAAAQRKAACP
jgi:hypothetical protein